MDSLTHRVVDVGGTRTHLVEVGSGPSVLLIHGFPESWYSWRHQLPALAAAGYRAIAIDVRGYGRSSKPSAIEAYRLGEMVADNVGVLDALGVAEATIVGHDWGAPIAWTSALLRPDRFTALATLSVPYNPRGSVRPTEAMRAMGGDEEFYVEYFQQPGRAEAEIEADVRKWLTGFYFSASGDAPPPSGAGTLATIPAGAKMMDRFAYPDPLPAWLTPADIDVYTSEFEYSGFFGPLCRYRNVDRDFDDLRFAKGQPIIVPSLFIGGDRDGPTIWGAAAIAAFPTTLPDLRGSHILPGCGHWVQQERATETNTLLVEFLASLAGTNL